jgi:hypothetical protein
MKMKVQDVKRECVQVGLLNTEGLPLKTGRSILKLPISEGTLPIQASIFNSTLIKGFS